MTQRGPVEFIPEQAPVGEEAVHVGDEAANRQRTGAFPIA